MQKHGAIKLRKKCLKNCRELQNLVIQLGIMPFLSHPHFVRLQVSVQIASKALIGSSYFFTAVHGTPASVDAYSFEFLLQDTF